MLHLAVFCMLVAAAAWALGFADIAVFMAALARVLIGLSLLLLAIGVGIAAFADRRLRT